MSETTNGKNEIRLVSPINYMIRGEDDILNIDTTGGITTLHIGNITTNGLDLIRKRIYINDITGNASVNNITINTIGGDTINGLIAFVLNVDGISAEIVIVDKTRYLANLSGDTGGGGGGITSVTATTPITSSGGATPNVSTSIATNRLVGRGTAGTGAMEEIILGTNLSLTGTTLNAVGGGGGGVASVTATAPISSSGGVNPDISITQSSGASNGFLTSIDWTTFNNKGSGTITNVSGTLPISSSGGATPDISISQSGVATNGFLTSIDWNTFNSKGIVNSVTASPLDPIIVDNIDPLNPVISSGILVQGVTATAPISSSGGITPDISISQSGVATNGFLTSIDWNTFNNKGSGTITNVSGTSPITSSGGVTPVISTSIATNRLVGRGTAGTGAMEEIILGTNLSLTGTTLNATNSGGSVTNVSALTLGTTGADLSSSVATSTTTPIITLNVPTASALNRGALSSADWTTFNNKGSGTITSVTATTPITSSGGVTPVISTSIATNRLVGRGTAGTGAMEEIILGTNLSLTGTTLNATGGGAGGVTSVSGTLNRIDSSGGTTPIIDISATYVGQTSITTLGTISTGIWNGTTIAVAYGGTGVTTSTGSGNNVLSISPTLVTPILGSASATALTFTSTAVSGLTINRLTTAQRQALTPVSGDVVYDTTIGTTCTYNGTFWEYSKEYYVTSFATTTTILASTITGLTTFILEANSTYDISGQFLIGCNGAGGVKFGNTLPAGGLSFINYVGTSTSVTALQQMPSNSGTLIATAINRLTGSSYLTFGGAITTLATAGSVDMQFASGVGGQTSTIYGQFSIGYQSKITLTKIA